MASDAEARPLPGLASLLVRSLATLRRTGKPLAPMPVARFRFAWLPASDRRLEHYRAEFGGFVSDLPLTWLYLPAQRAQLALMLQPGFPWPVPGLVHAANAMEWIGSWHADLPVELTVTGIVGDRALGPDAVGPNAESPNADAPVGARRSRHEVKLETTFLQSGRPCARCHSVYVPARSAGAAARTGRSSRTVAAGTDAAATEARGDPGADWATLEEWDLSGASARRYARMSGDWNPIHLHRATSVWFGYRHPIAHGMALLARSLATLERHFGCPVTALEARFRRPVALPARLGCRIESPRAREGSFALTRASDGASCVEGSYRCMLV